MAAQLLHKMYACTFFYVAKERLQRGNHSLLKNSRCFLQKLPVEAHLGCSFGNVLHKAQDTWVIMTEDQLLEHFANPK